MYDEDIDPALAWETTTISLPATAVSQKVYPSYVIKQRLHPVSTREIC